ncbi:MAG TPA: hypothetical protein VE307_05385 [Nitrososphaeraceae archaeon]|nr:hypothetical protein [Nitrososphaeraceae archaeon]
MFSPSNASRGLLEVGVSNGKYSLSIYKKELSELLNYSFNSAKDFQHKLRKRSTLILSISKKR